MISLALSLRSTTYMFVFWSKVLSEKVLPTANLSWNDNVHPHSMRFDDHYYSLINGLEESRHVFIQGNALLERWKKLSNNETFYIMETGFGSGLNFLATQQLWQTYLEKSSQHSTQQDIRTNNKLHYISIEAYPLTTVQLTKSLANWAPKLPKLTETLIKLYPSLIAGRHDLTFEADNVQLTLLFGDIKEQLPLIEHQDFKSHNNAETGFIDAWFLDGFSPSKNPDMWQSNLYQQMYRLSVAKATVATYTVAGIVRRGLTEAGFTVSKKPGFGTKRDMLFAQLTTSKNLTGRELNHRIL
jgi:tRNA 5-methylaminomethyl-2-thiouridine biosynthesis bifunctional protein